MNTYKASSNKNCILLEIPLDSKEWADKFAQGCPNVKPQLCKSCKLNKSDEP